jgi:large subunit ribosomal protein L24
MWLIFHVPESEKDTKASEVTEITFEPALKTFEMDMMERMGIEEDRVPAKTYWY